VFTLPRASVGLSEAESRRLTARRLADRSIASIAFGWGFGDLSGFNRAFRAAFGATPREVRGQRSGHARR
jgi:AraC-like DNA-binding protein